MTVTQKPTVLVIGIGNEYRSDDGLGLVIARKLKEMKIHHLEIIEESGEGMKLMELWQNCEKVILIDAISSGGKPGQIHFINPNKQIIPKTYFNYSSHSFGLAEAVELSRTMNQLPPSMMVFGIEGKNFNAGTKLSPEIENNIGIIIKRIVKSIDKPLSRLKGDSP